MLTRARSSVRAGTSLVEVIIAMLIAAIVLGVIATISLRQQRLFTDLTDAVALSGQLREAATMLPIDLRGISVSSGDVREARDTSIEFRQTIANGVVCDTIANGLVFAPSSGGAAEYASYLTTVDAGDTAWMFAAVDSGDAWHPFRVSGVNGSPPKQCAARGPHLDDSTRAMTRVSLALETPPVPLAATIGMPVRVTRPLRYSLYRASDGAWYLGAKDWNTGTARFNTIQPVSGPFLPPASGGLAFTYLDSTGAPLSTPVADLRAIAAIRIAVRGQTKHETRILGAAAPSTRSRDTATVVVLLHNRR